MKSTNCNIMRYDAEEGKVFDYKEPRFKDIFDEDDETVIGQEEIHLYAKTLIMGPQDSIDNYIEIDSPVVEV